MLTEKFITAYSTISRGTVSKNGLKVFENNTDSTNFLLSAYQHLQLNYPKFYKMDNLSKLGWLAAEVLLKDGFKNGNYPQEATGVILANSNSSLDDDLKYFESIKDIASPSLFVYTLPNIVIGEICIRNHFKGEHAFFIQDVFDADFIAQQVNYLMDKKILQACICGWVDVVEQEYKAVLFVVENKKNDKPVVFSADSMNDIFKKIGD